MADSPAGSTSPEKVGEEDLERELQGEGQVGEKEEDEPRRQDDGAANVVSADPWPAMTGRETGRGRCFVRQVRSRAR
ncbi:hypothetical protein HYQ46_007510 [Verticillium longisporum]|nr:hypothetical protein HYQ46_007510 [Verticillium longisporum]